MGGAAEDLQPTAGDPVGERGHVCGLGHLVELGGDQVTGTSRRETSSDLS
jgi:hypothetical protein